MKEKSEPLLVKVPTDKVHISEFNTRQPTEKDCASLITSMKASGQITPGSGRPHPTKKGHYELAAGARRLTSCIALGIPFELKVREMTDEELKDAILTDNMQREDPSPLAEAELIQIRLDEGAEPAEIEARYGRPAGWVRRRVKLLTLSTKAKKEAKPNGAIEHFTTKMLELFGSLPSKEQNRLINDYWFTRRTTTYEELLGQIQSHRPDLKGCDWLDEEHTFVKGCGPGCATHDKDALFPDENRPEGSCENEGCFKKRLEKHITHQIDEALKEDEDLTLPNCVLISNRMGHTFNYKKATYEVTPEWEWQNKFTVTKRLSKTKQKDAFRVLDLTVLTKPVLKWGQKISTATKAVKTAGGETTSEKTPAQKIQDSKDRLTGRRRARLIERLVEHLKECDPPKGTNPLHLLMAFGTETNRNYGISYQDPRRKEPWTVLENKKEAHPLNGEFGTKPIPIKEAAWLSVQPVLITRLNHGPNQDLLRKEAWHEVVMIAELTSFDLITRYKEIADELPAPKAWRDTVDPVTLAPLKGG